MKSLVEESISESIPHVTIAKQYLEEINTKFAKFDRNEKQHYLDMMNNSRYDGIVGVINHIVTLSFIISSRLWT